MKESQQNTIAPDSQCYAVEHRVGKAVLKDIIHRLRHQADALQSLHDMLPEKPTAQQDEALWTIACKLERQ